MYIFRTFTLMPWKDNIKKTTGANRIGGRKRYKLMVNFVGKIQELKTAEKKKYYYFQLIKMH